MRRTSQKLVLIAYLNELTSEIYWEIGVAGDWGTSIQASMKDTHDKQQTSTVHTMLSSAASAQDHHWNGQKDQLEVID